MKRRGPRHFKPQKTSPKVWREALEIVDLTDDGRGLARRQGKAVFVPGALPDERIEARSVRIGGRYDEAELIQLLEGSPQRVLARCIHYEQCGGCQLQHLHTDAQIAHKAQRFAGMCSRLGFSADLIGQPLLGAAWHYRHRVRLHFAVKHGEVVMGFKVAKSHRITPVPECQVLRPNLAAAVQRLYKSQHVLRKLYAGSISLSEFDDGSVTAHVALDKRPSQMVQSELLTHFPLRVSALVCGQNQLWVDEMAEEGCYPGQRWRLRPDDFSQVNPEVNQLMLERVGDWLGTTPEDHILDAFSGLGNFSLMLAAAGAQVTAVEHDEAMVARAARNAAGWPRLCCEQDDLYSNGFRLPPGITKVLLDPPRAGADKFCRLLAQSAVQRLVYVSCDPATLERDAQILLEGGFQLREALWADMFPQSYHMESLMLFERSVL